MKMEPVTHFQMPADDKKRVAGFYSKVFGWSLNQLGPEMGDYMLARTTETDDKGMPKKPGTINGGFFTPTDDPNSRRVTVVIAVEDIRKSMEKIKAAGGTMAMSEPDKIPGVGLFATFKDTEGNFVAMLEPAGM